MRELTHWMVPGLALAGPLQLFLERWVAAPPWPVWLLVAPVIGFVVLQFVRARFEGHDGGFRNPRRAALAVIIDRGGLAPRPDRGDLAYQVYEVVLYQRADWQAARDHEHRSREFTFLCWSVAAVCVGGVVLSLLGFRAQPALAASYLLVLPLVAAGLRAKARQTLDALELFDRGLVLAHWPFYEAALRAIVDGGDPSAVK